MAHEYSYIRLAINDSLASTNNSPADALTVRKIIQDSLIQTFGSIYANSYVDVLWVGPSKENGPAVQHAVVRTSTE
jgi:hypothetical protein